MGTGHSEHKQHLIGLARQRAFETYLRFGRMPDTDSRPAERKAVNPLVAMPTATPTRATRYYVWRSSGDDRVRSSHAARHGQIFAWAEPPAGGHPGSERNCRCWPEPYYGDPSVPDALQPLRHSRQVDTTGNQLWASIETLTRNDGSLAQSVVVDRGGTQIWSRFAGKTVEREVLLSDGQIVHVDTHAGLQSVYVGNDSRPLFQSGWTESGPKVIRAQQRVAFLGDPDTLIDPNAGPGRRQAQREPGVVTVLPNISGLIALALVALYSIQQDAPASQGLGADDEPVAVVKTWALDLPTTTPVLVDAQAEEQFRQNCKHRDVIELWAIEATAKAATYQDVTSPQTFGIRAHKLLKDKVENMREQFPELYGTLQAEISFVDGNEKEVPYGTKGSSRLDILEDRRDDMGAICVYDMKAGAAALTMQRVERIGSLVSRIFPGVPMIYITQVGPFVGGISKR